MTRRSLGRVRGIGLDHETPVRDVDVRDADVARFEFALRGDLAGLYGVRAVYGTLMIVDADVFNHSRRPGLRRSPGKRSKIL